MSKKSGKLKCASFSKICLISGIKSFTTELRVLGHSHEEVAVAVDRVGIWELLVPDVLCEDGGSTLDIFSGSIVVNVANQVLSSLDSSFFIG